MKLASVRSQDQRRMLQANSHTFPTNDWIHKITKGKESDRCDLCMALRIAEGRCSPPVLATDPWRIGQASGPRMEVFVYLRREMPPG
jgi:hypothetical protein